MTTEPDNLLTALNPAAPPVVSSPLASLIHRAPESCPPDTPVRDVLERMRDLGIGSMIVTGADAAPVGIFTLQDVLTRVALAGPGLDLPVSRVMTAKVATLPASASGYEAALLMVRHGIHHVVIVEDGRLAGVVSERDLFSRLGTGLRQISNAMRRADNLQSYQSCSTDIQRLAQGMLEQGAGAAQVTQLISTLNDVLTQRIIELETAQLRRGGLAYCWIALGSEGRCEQTFNSDQDNGIIFAPTAGVPDAAAREALLPHARHINKVLDACGFALCRGGIMGGNAQWCLSLAEWQERFADWIGKGDPAALLNASIFFDFRPLHGEHRLAGELRAWLRQYTQDNNRFLMLMTQNALGNQPPLGLLRDFILTAGGEHPHTLDLKVNGITPFVDAARIYALAAGVTTTSTSQRLREAAAILRISGSRVEAWLEGFHFIQLLRLRTQLALSRAGEPVHNMVDPAKLNAMERRVLKEAMRQARDLQACLQKSFAPGNPAFGV
jgi:CBS domain-containing protein